MAIPQLSPEQVQNWSRRQKDEWWLANVFRGDMAQLTLRAGVTGFILGGLLSATNLYVGAKTGWTLGVGLTSVILAFATFRVMSKIGFKDMTILENNATQSVATAAGYMTGPLISGIAAYMWVENKVMPWWQMLIFCAVLSILGVLVAFPMKRKFINDEQQPFPEGRACGVVLDTLYTSAAAVGMFKAKALGIAALIAGTISFISGESYMRLIQEKWLKLSGHWHLSHNLDEWYYWMVSKGWVPLPKLAGVDIRELALRPALDLAMFGAGALMGIKSACSMMIGMVLNFVIIVPLAIYNEDLTPAKGTIADGTATFGRAYILNNWALWWGIAIMVTAAMVSLFAKPEIFVQAFRALTTRSKAGDGNDPVRHIELPLWISWVGIPVVGVLSAWMAHDWFGVSWVFGLTAIPLIIFLTLIAASSTALTGITPTGALSKIPQFGFGALDPKHPPTNLMTGVMCVEVASNASNLLMDIKPGYMLGAKPRQQAIAHCIGIISGALASTFLFYALFLNTYTEGSNVRDAMLSTGYPFPSAEQWKGVSTLVTSVFDPTSATATGKPLLTYTVKWSMAIACAVGLIMEIWRIRSKGKFPLSPLAIGLGVVVPPDSTMAMFAGALFFWFMHRLYAKREGSFAKQLWVDTHEPICAGIIAGAALIGIGDTLVKVFVLK